MSIGRSAITKIGGKTVGSVGYGLMSEFVNVLELRADYVDTILPGLSMPWNPIEPSMAVKLMKAALDQGANLWNGVRTMAKIHSQKSSAVDDTTCPAG